jgi:O-antigen ligase
MIALDPILSQAVPADLWHTLGLGRSPLRLTPLVAVLLLLGLAGVFLRHRIGSFGTVALGLLLVTSQMNGIGAGPLDLFDIALFGLLFVWIATVGTDPHRTVPIPPLLYAAIGLLILGIAHMPLLSPVVWVVGMFGMVRIALVVFLVVDLCRDPRTLDLVFRIFFAVAVASALVGIVQFVLAYFGIVHFTFIDPPKSAFKPSPVGFVMRASGLCITAQHFSSFLVYALPIALWRASESRSLLSVAGCVIILGGIGVSLNFGGIFAALLVLGLFPLLRWPNLAIHLVMAMLALLAVAHFTGVLDLVYDLTFGDSGVSKGVDQRKTLFILGLEQIDRSPLIGTGLRGFAEVDGNFWERPVHNLFGQAASELGLLAALLMGAIFFFLTLGLFPLFARTETRRAAGILLLMLAAAFLLGQAEPNLDQSNLWLVFALAQAAILVGRRSAR